MRPSTRAFKFHLSKLSKPLSPSSTVCLRPSVSSSCIPCREGRHQPPGPLSLAFLPPCDQQPSPLRFSSFSALPDLPSFFPACPTWLVSRLFRTPRPRTKMCSGSTLLRALPWPLLVFLVKGFPQCSTLNDILPAFPPDGSPSAPFPLQLTPALSFQTGQVGVTSHGNLSNVPKLS